MKNINDTKEWIKVKWDRGFAVGQTYYSLVKTEVIRYKDLAFSDEYNNYFAAVSFFPFVGWLIPMYLKKDDPFCREQSKTGA